LEKQKETESQEFFPGFLILVGLGEEP